MAGGRTWHLVPGAGALTTSRGLLARQQDRPATRLGVLNLHHLTPPGTTWHHVAPPDSTWHPPGQEVAGHPIPGPEVQQLLLGRVIHRQLGGGR